MEALEEKEGEGTGFRSTNAPNSCCSQGREEEGPLSKPVKQKLFFFFTLLLI